MVLEDELVRRKGIKEGDAKPALNGMGDGDERSPAYGWECSTCPVGAAIECENYIWDADGKEKVIANVLDEEGRD